MADKKYNNTKKKNSRTDNGTGADLKLVIFIAACAIAELGIFGLFGPVGEGIRFVCFGMFGAVAYAFPPFVFFIYIFAAANRRKPLFVRKLAGLIGLFVFTCAFLEILMIGYRENANITDSFFGAVTDGLGGGLTGGAIVSLFGSCFGGIGAMVVIVILLIIFAILFTQKPLVTVLRTRGQQTVSSMKSSRQERQEAAEARREAARERREARRAAEEEAAAERERTAAAERRQRREAEPEPVPVAEAAPVQKIHIEGDIAEDEDIMEDDARTSSARAPKQPRERRRKISSDETVNDEVVRSIEKGQRKKTVQSSEYRVPPVSLLKKGTVGSSKDQIARVRETARRLQETLHNFGVEATVINATCGPTVTRYELQPEQGVKVSRIVGLSDDIKLNLAAEDIRIEAPIPGKAAVGIEVPNKTNNTVCLRDMIDTKEFRDSTSRLSFAVGKDLAGKPVITDISKMPHLLIAGATGSGKSVCINTLILSILYKAAPDEVKFLMIDPKVVELSCYNGIPHLLIPVVSDPKKAAGALQWAVLEMTRRYNIFAEFGVRELSSFNTKVSHQSFFAEDGEDVPGPMPQIVVIVDELADLMMQTPKEVEDSICRIAQLGRAAGIHLIIATQRPSVNVITGLIKANMPSRIALAVTSGIDSRVILDMNGAEKLLGKGDMLFYPQSYPKPARVQGGYVSDGEIQGVVDFIKNNAAADNDYDAEVIRQIDSQTAGTGAAQAAAPGDDHDEYFAQAGRFIIEKDKASIGMLQRVYKIGFNRAARIMDQLCDAGVVGEEEGTKPRKILMNMEQFENYLEEMGQ